VHVRNLVGKSAGSALDKPAPLLGSFYNCITGCAVWNPDSNLSSDSC
jgi:hypothetical protein